MTTIKQLERFQMVTAVWILVALVVSSLTTIGQPSGETVVFGNLVHSRLGNARLETAARGLLVTNIGVGGQDGVSIGLQELSRTVGLRFEPVRLTGLGARRLAVTMRGMVNDTPDRPLGALVLVGRTNGVALAVANVSPGWLDRFRIEVFNGAARIGQVELQTDATLSLVASNARVVAVTVGQADGQSTNPTLWEVEFDAVVNAAPGAGPELNGNRLRIVGLNPAGQIQNLARLDVTGNALGSFMILEETAPRFRPRLRVETRGARIEVSWDTRSAVLQQGSNLWGPWADLVSDTNRIELARVGTNRFFRILTRPFEPCNLPLFSSRGYVCKRNVLLIIVDDVGVDQLPIYTGYYNANASVTDDMFVRSTGLNPAVTTPTIDRLAASGVTFLNAWSSPTCSPTRAGLFTGTASFRHGVYSPTAPYLTTNATTIAHVLRANGYGNGLFGKWHLGADEAHLPFSFGWSRHEGGADGDLTDYYDWLKEVNIDDSTGRSRTQVTVTTYATHENVDNALAWIGAQTNPWMATVSFNAPHWANDGAGNYYQFPPAGCEYATRANNDKGKYRSMLECADISLTNLLTGIDSNVLAQTTIIFMGDNGTERAISDHFPAGHNKSSLYEGGVNVPLIIADGYAFLYGVQSSWTKGLGRVESPGRFETNLVQTMDVFATAAEIGRADGSCGVDSVSIVPYLASTSATPRREVTFAETYTGGIWNVAVRNQTHKLIVRGYCGAAPTYELYDLSTDRWETTIIPENGTSATATDLLAHLATLLAVPATCPVTPEYAVPTVCP